MSLCKYANLFGAPGTGAHSLRIANTAVVDVVATALLAYVTQLALQRAGKQVNYWVILLTWIVVGEALHYIFCVPTSWQVAVGLAPRS
jgi:hypothetical protein